MGITGLLPLLTDSSRPVHISEFKGLTLAIDSYCWLHKGAFGCCEKLARGENTNAYVSYCLKYLKMLQHYNIRPIMVFDGRHLPAKAMTEKKRREQRNLARKRAAELLRLDRPQEAQNYLRQCIDVTHEMALALIKECRSMGIDCLVAPYEADAQLAYLNIQKIADVVVTEDSDLTLFGCSRIIFKLDLGGNGVFVDTEKLYLSLKMRPDVYTFDKFRHMCILSGCDYLQSLPGIGLKKALKFLKLTANPDIYDVLKKLPSYLNMRQLEITDEYRENFMIADATFRHQVVFDPLKRKLTRLLDPEAMGTRTEHLKNAGDFFDDETAFQLALGNLDPFTLKRMDSWHPDKVKLSCKSIWAKSYSKQPVAVFQIAERQVSIKSTKEITLELNTEALSKENEEFDEKLSNELKQYTLEENNFTEVIETVEEEVEKERSLSPVLPVKKAFNPFLKKQDSFKKLSKFPRTVIDTSCVVKSRFFQKADDDNNKSRSAEESPEKQPNAKRTKPLEIHSESHSIEYEEDIEVTEATEPFVTLETNHSTAKDFIKTFSHTETKTKTICVDLNEDLENLTPPSSSGSSSSQSSSGSRRLIAPCRTLGLSKKSSKKTIGKNQLTLLSMFSSMHH